MTTKSSPAADPYLWLEEVEGDEALGQVKRWNERTSATVSASPLFAAYERRAREIYDDERRIAMPSVLDGYIYNFWSDKTNLRGVWRRSPEAAYLSGSPEWDVLLDVDALCETENANWVWGGADILRPDGDRAIVMLSDGGKDAVVVREFDLQTRTFVVGGHTVPDAKTQTSWLDRNAIFITSDFGEGSLTASGYPRQVRKWIRGTELADAPLIDEVAVDEIRVHAFVARDTTGAWPVIVRQKSFWSSSVFHLAPDDQLHAAPLPASATLVGSVGGFMVAQLHEDNDAGPAGALVAYDIAAVVEGKQPDLELVLNPPHNGSIEAASGGKSTLFASLIENVVGSIVRLDRSAEGVWIATKLPAPENSSIFLAATDPDSDRLFFMSVGLTTPQTLHLYAPGEPVREIASAPTRFDADLYSVEQKFATSADGTRVPYFLVKPKAAVGPVPTLLYAYGGFRASTLPSYVGPLAQFLLEAGCAYAIANIRGGGEFGPAWHAAALRENRQRAFDDFHAVAANLKADGTTSRLGIYGGSNGGLLVGVAYTQKPELYDAVICSVPLADMQRYHKLLAGASWVGEYGDPDNADDWEFLSRYSPYHNLSADAAYPPVLFQTSTKDDRVHPGHARKMAARMEEMGHRIDYYENIDGGHGGSADNSQAAHVSALLTTWLRTQLDI